MNNKIKNVPDVRRPERNIKKPSRFNDNFVYSGCIYRTFAGSPRGEKGGYPVISQVITQVIA